jgi:hypothetical protein
LILVTLAGCLAVTMASNLITLAMASALLDIGLIATTVFAPHNADRVTWRMVVPGVGSTLLIVLSALQMNALVGTATLSAREIPLGILAFIGVAGLLRLVIFPLHPRNLHTPENAVVLLLSTGAGIYLLVRSQTIATGPTDPGWMVAIGGVALLAGGLLAWTASAGQTGKAGTLAPLAPEVQQIEASTPLPPGAEKPRVAGVRLPIVARVWSGAAIHQAGLAISFILLARNSVPWPFFGLALALGITLIWWDSTSRRADGSQSQSPPVLIGRRWMEKGSTDTGCLQTCIRFGPAILPVLAMASLAGAPLTAGGRVRWMFYGALLGQTESGLLIPALVADSLLIAGLATVFRTVLKRPGNRLPSPAAFLAMLALGIPLLALGIAPGVLDLEPTQLSDVSTLGLGLIYALPWVLGLLLSRLSARLAVYVEPLYRLTNLDWLFRAANWFGQRLGNLVYWVGQIGEGQGWFGWVLIILALGTMLLIVR